MKQRWRLNKKTKMVIIDYDLDKFLDILQKLPQYKYNKFTVFVVSSFMFGINKCGSYLQSESLLYSHSLTTDYMQYMYI